MTLYAILDIPADADDRTIRHAYKVLARRYHPDYAGESSAPKFRQIARAYETLIEPALRREYDRSLPTRQTPMPVPVEPMISKRGIYYQTYDPRAPFEELCNRVWAFYANRTGR